MPKWRTKGDVPHDGYVNAALVDVIVRKTCRLRALARIDDVLSCSAIRLPRPLFLAAHERASYRLAWKARDAYTFLFLREPR